MDSSLEKGVAAAKASWSAGAFPRVDDSAFDEQKEKNAGPHVEAQLVTEPNRMGRPVMSVGENYVRLPSGPRGEARLAEIAGKLPDRISESLGVSQEQAQDLAKQMVLLHELGHCKDYEAMRAGMEAASKGKESYGSWAKENPALEKAIPLPVREKLEQGAGPKEIKSAFDSDATQGQMEASADVFAVEAGAKAGLWDRQKMYKAMIDWRKKSNFNDLEHDTRTAMRLAAASPVPVDHNENAVKEVETLRAMPGHPEGLQWNDRGDPVGMSKEKMFDLKRREVLTGLDLTENAPGTAPAAPQAQACESSETAPPKLGDLSGKLASRRAQAQAPAPAEQAKAKQACAM